VRRRAASASGSKANPLGQQAEGIVFLTHIKQGPARLPLGSRVAGSLRPPRRRRDAPAWHEERV